MLAGALCVIAATVAAVQVLLLLDRSLGHPPGWRQAAIPLGFALVAGPFLLWTLRREGSGRAWLRLRAPVPGTGGRLAWIAALGMLSMWGVALACAQFPAYRRMVEGQVDLGGWHGPAELLRAAFFLGAMPAFFEELYFRGYLLDRLGRHWGPLGALLAQTALFAPLHGPAAPVAAVLGLLNGTLVLVGGSLWPGMVLHLANNLLALAALRVP
ncbi:MAG TPA: type II CAAX endopeptidase family protein [Candidatus Saccharimonadales bacterium]|nr:type II CAAX endopeptidase family protein [Candidatus Saccharimonadales bacterium]